MLGFWMLLAQRAAVALTLLGAFDTVGATLVAQAFGACITRWQAVVVEQSVKKVWRMGSVFRAPKHFLTNSGNVRQIVHRIMTSFGIVRPRQH